MILRRGGAFDLDLTLQVGQGETLALLGPNGAGKTTVVESIAGLLPIDEGRIELQGRVLDDPAEGVFLPPSQRGIGIVFQDLMLFPHLDVMENVAFGPRSRGIGRAMAATRAGELLSLLGLGEMAGRRPAELSGGEAQRVALARALAIEPSLLILDEPMSALDAGARPAVRRLLAHTLAGFPGPCILITHDPVDAFLLADRVVILEEGRVTQTGTADEIRLRPRTRYAADLVGVNLLRGDAADGRVLVGSHSLEVADQNLRGAVLVTIHPHAIALYDSPPGAGPLNVWKTTVDLIEDLGMTVRILTGGPLPLTVEVTKRTGSRLAVGDTTWLAVKATEIELQPVD
jgi:molybdate transport system ATP-binding protein